MNELELKDIHLPDSSLWWPLAPGWWLLLAMLALGLLVLLWMNWRRHHQPVVRLAMGELDSIRQAHVRGQEPRATVNAVAGLLRRTLISYRGRVQHAATTGEDWLAELDQLAPRHGFGDEHKQLLAQGRYQANLDCDVEDLLRACESWIRNLPRGQGHVSA
ncbi:MAG: DUF4381 domain-containing protein [Gammaproteobacteria bacterium]|nr:DUF4381 domain-containing protein [Gammaproteobacteria bacterium]